MLVGLQGVSIYWRKITWKLVDKHKINIVWVFAVYNDKRQKYLQKFLQFLCPKSGKDLVSHLQSVGSVAQEMIWLKSIQQPLSKAAWSF